MFTFFTPIYCLFLCIAIAANATANVTIANDKALIDLSQNTVIKATQTITLWNGPTSGPKAANKKNITFIAADLRNGGIRGVAEGASEAASSLGWNLKFIDGQGSPTKQTSALTQALQAKTDGLILGGIDAASQLPLLKIAKQLNIPVVGWHATDIAGAAPELHLFTNITTDPIQVAKVAAHYAIADSQGTAQVVVFTDNHYKIAQEKSATMIKLIQQCKQCKLLELIDLSLSQTAEFMPQTIERLLDKYGNNITHFLAINDLYFDYAQPSLQAAGITPQQAPKSISAGDGSETAYKRIRLDKYQVATVAEPLLLHGWQAIDELNRAFMQSSPSNYISPTQLINRQNIIPATKARGLYEPENNYRKAYLSIWN